MSPAAKEARGKDSCNRLPCLGAPASHGGLPAHALACHPPANLAAPGRARPCCAARDLVPRVPWAVPGGEGGHVSALHVPRVRRRRAVGAASQGRRGHHLPPQGRPPPAPPLPKTLVAALSRLAPAPRSSCGARLWQVEGGRLQLAAGDRAPPSEGAAAGDADASQGGVRAQARACACGAAFAVACAGCVRMRARMGALRGARAPCRACGGVGGCFWGGACRRR